jgi:hypothetical protein
MCARHSLFLRRLFFLEALDMQPPRAPRGQRVVEEEHPATREGEQLLGYIAEFETLLLASWKPISVPPRQAPLPPTTEAAVTQPAPDSARAGARPQLQQPVPKQTPTALVPYVTATSNVRYDWARWEEEVKQEQRARNVAVAMAAVLGQPAEVAKPEASILHEADGAAIMEHLEAVLDAVVEIDT